MQEAAKHNERKKLIYSMLFPALLLSIMWLIKITETFSQIRFIKLGNYPLQWEYFTGIITSPFIHGDYEHLISNTFPFLILGTALFYFYRQYALKILLFIFLFSGLFVWLTARPAFHIGASGVVYALASFLIFSGFLHNNKELTSIAFIVVFIYGSMVWGVLPGREGISWEGHLSGALTGFLAALFFSKKIDLTQQKIKHHSYYDYGEINISDEQFTHIQYHQKKEEE